MARRTSTTSPPTEQSEPRKGAVLKTTTSVALIREQSGPTRYDTFLGTDYRTFHGLPLSALQEFVDAVHEVVGTGSDELGVVTTANNGITYTITATILENIK